MGAVGTFDDSAVRDLKYFHGFLPREDLASLLKNDGEYLLRCTEVDSNSVERNLIISYFNGRKKGSLKPSKDGVELSNENVSQMNSVQGGAPATKKIRNVVLHKKDSKFYVKIKSTFATIIELIKHHSENEVTIGDFLMKLGTPIERQSWELSHSDVELLKPLGQGEFGEVRSGRLHFSKEKVVKVAVKLTKGTSELSKIKRREMMAEARLMRDLKHPNVVRIYGVAVLEMPLYIVLELIDGNSLESFLKSQGKSVQKRERRKIVTDIAFGLEYIHSKNLIHRDLAARNCLINSKLVTKISDFGMSRCGPEYKLSGAAKVPLRWMAPETLQTFTFNCKSDVWSFGMIVYEIYWEGAEPYEGKSNGEVKAMLLEGVRPNLPLNASRVLSTWFADRVFVCEKKRATSEEVVQFLEVWSGIKRRMPNTTDESDDDSSNNESADAEEGKENEEHRGVHVEQRKKKSEKKAEKNSVQDDNDDDVHEDPAKNPEKKKKAAKTKKTTRKKMSKSPNS